MQKNTRFILIGLLVLGVAYFFLSSRLADDAPLTVDVDTQQLDSVDAEDENTAADTVATEDGSETNIETPVTIAITDAANVPTSVNPSALTAQSWVWRETVKSTGEVIIPAKEGSFVLTFRPDGTFSAQTDCNGVGGVYQVDGQVLTFGQMASTKMFCAESQEKDFTDTLAQTQRFSIKDNGELELGLMLGFGTGVFSPLPAGN